MSAKVSLDLQRQLFARSERVKGIDFHPTEPWVRSPPDNTTLQGDEPGY